jgi:hypothetical protein
MRRSRSLSPGAFGTGAGAGADASRRLTAAAMVSIL